MKNSIIFLAFVLANNILAQVYNNVIYNPQSIPCLTITQSNLPGLGSGIQSPDCIETDGNVTFLQYENYSIKAGEYIQFNQNTVIDPDNAHQFHAYIDNGGMDIAWYEPTTAGTVGQFEKLELGVQFRDDIKQQIKNFTDFDPHVSPYLNPFNPEQVNLYAEFWWYSDGSNPLLPAGWYGPQLANGFYYEEYIRGTDDWTTVATEHDFRIRFAPRQTGLWRCKITAIVQGFGTFTASEFTFNCVPSGSKDFVRVGDNKRYFKIGDEPFFPVGHNVTWPRGATTDNWERSYTTIVKPSYFVYYQQQMSDVINNGGNYIRFINNPWSTDCEFEELNDYSDRMIHSWELDNILEHANEIDLRIHFNLQIHYNFEVPDGYGASFWDWPKYGDDWSSGSCFSPLDNGYCYRSDLGLISPLEFFTNADAKKFYKYKLRYLIARYGYSNEIAVMELFSEINNAGAIHNMQLEVVGYEDDGVTPKYGCKDQGGPGTGKPYVFNFPNIAPIIGEWQHEMGMYIKSETQHTNHILAVNYTGPPNLTWDQSFSSQYFDINTYNAYQVLIAKHAQDVGIVDSFLTDFNKPFMFSEYGPGGGEEKCDNGTHFIKSLTLSPFLGTAGAAMNWDWQYTDHQFLWHHMGPVNQLMSGIPLDDEFWQAMPPIVSTNKAVEVLYLRNFVEDNYRAVGAVSNRTYNYYTQATDSPCDDAPLNESELDLNPIYQDTASFEYQIGGHIVFIPNMDVGVEYTINWYNALTGQPVDTITTVSTETHLLPLYFPKVTGSSVQPILFFEIYRSNQSTFKSAEKDSSIICEKVVFPIIQVDNKPSLTPLTNWNSELAETSNKEMISLFPNPTINLLNVQLYFNEYTEVSWYIQNELGETLNSGMISSSNLSIDLTTYPNGLYFFYILTKDGAYANKIIKQ